MRTSLLVRAFVVAAGIAVSIGARQPGNRPDRSRVDPDDLGGVVTGAKGPEAGVWVIAETTDLPTRFARIVVTDDRGRYLVPDLPKATYSVWVRGYGLADSAKVQSTPGKLVNLDGNAGARCQHGSPDLSRRLLVLVDEGARQG